MKKRIILPLILLAGLLLFALTSCKNSLATPGSLAINDDVELSWEAVNLARAYTIEIKSADGSADPILKNTLKTHFSLKDLAMGDYEVRVMATGGENNAQTSAWSEPLFFHRDYDSGCVYELINNNTEYRVKKAGTASGVVLIEGTYRGKPVTEIGENAFKGNRHVQEITIGENLRKIGDFAFYNCSELVKVTLPDTVTEIGKSAFQGCHQLKTVNVPAGVTVIPAFCFSYCRSLSEIRLGEGIVNISESAFNGTSLSEVVIPDSVIYVGPYAFSAIEGLTSVRIGSGTIMIDSDAFSQNASLTTVTFAETSALQSVGARCFANCRSLTEIKLPDGLRSIEYYCFYMCEQLTSLSIPATVTHVGSGIVNATPIYAACEGNFVYADGWLAGVKDITTVSDISVTTLRSDTVGICDYCFSSAEGITTVALPDSVKYIGQHSFSGLENLKKFESGNGLLEIQAYAFADCPILTRALLKKGLKTIGVYAFRSCALLDNNSQEDTSIVPDTVTKVGQYAFYDTMLWTKSDSYGVIYAGNWIVGFDETKSPSAVILKQGMTGVADYAFYNCKTLQSIQYLSDCRYIGVGAFYGCSDLAAVTLNTNLRTIESFTFYGCSSLFQVSFPRQLVSVGDGAFYRCELLMSLDFSSCRYFESIGNHAFYGCVNLKSVDFGDHLTSIDEYAFARCLTINNVVIPDTVEQISDRTFYKCDFLTNVTIGNGVKSIGEYAFYKCALRSVRIPDSVETIGKYAFYSNEGISEITLGNGLRSIDNYAFYGAAKLERLALPENLKNIGKYAFKGCSLLCSVILPENLEEISANAFYGCYGVTFYTARATDGDNWNGRWNSSNRPVIHGVTLSENKDYVVSVTVDERLFTNMKNLSDKILPFNAPERDGYRFDGWQDADGNVIDANALSDAPSGTVLTAIWTELPPPVEED